MFAHLLPQLHYFWVAAKTGNFTQAAHEAFVSQSAISHQINQLEDKLSVQLFDRKRGGVSLTPAGDHLFKTCDLIFKEIERGTEELTSSEPKGVLRIVAPSKFGNALVLGGIKKLLVQHPEVEPVLNVANDISNFYLWNSDIIVSGQPMNVAGFTSLPIYCSRISCAAAPRYLKKRPPIKKPADVTEHILISRDERMSDWQSFFKSYGIDQRLNKLHKISIGSIEAANSLAVEGYGLVYSDVSVIETALRSKKLKEIILSEKPFYNWLFLVFRRQPKISPRIRAFLEVLKVTLREIDVDGGEHSDAFIPLVDSAIKGRDVDCATLLQQSPPAAIAHHE